METIVDSLLSVFVTLGNVPIIRCPRNVAALLWAGANPFTSAYLLSTAGLPHFWSSTLCTSPWASVAFITATAAAAGKQIEGANGCG